MRFQKYEERASIYREGGIDFYHKFPTDSRCAEWLIKTMRNQPVYFKKPSRDAKLYFENKTELVEMDEVKQRKWDRFYRGEIKPAI